MTLIARIIVGLLLLAHGLVHLLYLFPSADDPKYPFTLTRSWLLPGPTRRPVALVLITAVVLGFLASALALWGVPGLSGHWSATTIAAASMSIALLIAFWDRQLWIGVLIDALLVAAALVPLSWVDALLP
jgi:multisubunit Na+/H+ antiporter MnhC subunit